MRLRPWQFLLLLAAVLILITYGFTRFRARLLHHGTDLVSLLPEQSEATTFYVDVAVLRVTHILGLISTQKTQDADYRSFLDGTGFDYTRDLDAVAGRLSDSGNNFVAEGRFDWNRLEAYARQTGGSCHSSMCVLPSRSDHKWISFRSIDPGVLALSVSEKKDAVERIGTHAHPSPPLAADPVWINLPGSALKHVQDWPLPAQLVASTLRPAHSVTLSAGLHDGLRLQLKAHFGDAHTAQIVRNQLDIDTRMLKLELTREHEKPNPADLTGLLTSGTFQLAGSDVTGHWPIDQQLLQALEIQ